MRLFRRGSSAPITMMFGAVAIVIALLMFAIAAQALIGGYERRAHGVEMRAREVKRSLEAEICLYQRVENQTLVNETLITLRNSWPDEVRVDYFAAISKSGGILYESPLNITLGPGDSITLKPSDLGLPSKYDGDFWLMKREVAYLQFHVSGRGMASTHPSIWRMHNTTGLEQTKTTITTTVITIETNYTTTTVTTNKMIPWPILKIQSLNIDNCDGTSCKATIRVRLTDDKGNRYPYRLPLQCRLYKLRDPADDIPSCGHWRLELRKPTDLAKPHHCEDLGLTPIFEYNPRKGYGEVKVRVPDLNKWKDCFHHKCYYYLTAVCGVKADGRDMKAKVTLFVNKRYYEKYRSKTLDIFYVFHCPSHNPHCLTWGYGWSSNEYWCVFSGPADAIKSVEHPKCRRCD